MAEFPLWWSLTAAVLLTMAFSTASIAIAGWLFLQPRLANQPHRDLLIAAAHQDDAVIMAGEHAIEARAGGRHVQVAYFTCGDRHPGTQRSVTRRDEAIRAWQSIGVGVNCLHFLGLPNSPLRGPSTLSAKQVYNARQWVEKLIQTLPGGAAVIVPALGESHIDHRTLRRICLDALRSSTRTDLVVFEAPEYNAHYSLLRGPRRALTYVIRTLPLVSRLWKSLNTREEGTFVNGGPGLILPPDARRLERKRQMLRHFESEDGDLLLRLFKYPDHLRQVSCLETRDASRGYLRLGERRVGSSVVALWLLLFGGAFLSFSTVSLSLAQCTGLAQLASRGCVAAALVALLYWTIVRQHSVERRLFFLAASAGLVSGVL